MAIEFNDNFHVKINRPTDFRFGPFSDIAQANSLIPIAQRYHGLIFGIYTTPLDIANSDIDFYYYYDGLTDVDYLPFGGSGKPPIDGDYVDQAAMIAAQTIQSAQYIYYDGTSYWEYLGTINGDIYDYRRLESPPVLNSYASQIDMLDDQPYQTAQYIYYDGISYWEYLGTTGGNISDYRQVSAPIYGIDGITNQGDNELTLGGFIIEPTTVFQGYKDVPLEIQNILNSLTTYTIPASSSGYNAALYNTKIVLTDKILFTSGGLAIIFNSDGTVYRYDNKPWIYTGVSVLRNTLVNNTHVFMVGTFGTTFGTYDEDFNPIPVPDKVTVIKIDIETGIVDVVFTFKTNNTYNGAASLYRCILVNSDSDLYVDSNMFTYDGGPNAFYMHVIDGNTGNFKFGNTLPNALNSCIDQFGCGQRWAFLYSTTIDSQNRLYISNPLSQYFTIPTSPFGIVRGIVRLNLNVFIPETGQTISYQVDPTFNINFTSYTYGSSIVGYNVLIPTPDGSILLATSRTSTVTTTQIDDLPTTSILKFDELSNRDLNFGIGTGGKKGIYSHTNLNNLTFNYIREDRTGVYRLYSETSILYNNDIVNIYVNYLFFDQDGLIIEDYEGFMFKSSNLNKKIYQDEFEIPSSSIQPILHPTENSIILHSPTYGNIFRYSDKTKKIITSLNTFSYYELITKQYNISSYNQDETVETNVDKNITLGYTFDNNIKLNDQSFITKSFIYRKLLPELIIDFKSLVDLNDVATNGNVTDERLTHADGIGNQDSATLGQVNVLIADVVDDIESRLNLRTFGITIDGASNPIVTGIKGYAIIPYDCEILAWYIVADTVGSVEIDVWKAASIPTGANSICGADRPRLVSAQENQNETLTTWTIAVTSSDVVAFNVVSASVVTRVNLIIKTKVVV